VIEGLRASPVPVLAVGMDTFTAAMGVSNIRPSLTVEAKRKIAAALGIMESSVDLPGLLERVAVAGSGRVTPLMFQYELVRRAKQQRRHIVLPEGTEERILRAAEIVLLRDICDITLLGNQEELKQKASALGLSLDRAQIVDPRTSDCCRASPTPTMSCAGTRAFRRSWRGHDGRCQLLRTMMVYRGFATAWSPGRSTLLRTPSGRRWNRENETGDLDRLERLLHGSCGPGAGIPAIAQLFLNRRPCSLPTSRSVRP